MNPIDSSDSEAEAETVGWHLIARGGDMTARVHPCMQLGVLPSGDFSFEAPNAVVALDIEDEHLSLKVVSAEHELEIGDGQRLSELKVSPQTHICLDFLGHTLDIDNDFAVGSAPGDALEIYVVRQGEARLALGPLSASHHPEATGGEILISEQFAGQPLAAVPVDHLQREHLAARADKRAAAQARSGVGRIIGVLAGSALVIFVLVVVALSIANRSSSVEEAIEPPVVADTGNTSVAVSDTRVGSDVLARFSALLEVQPLPDKTTIDFAVESLKSLMVAYPQDPNVPDALSQLTERLVGEARFSYDQGDAFLAGRLIEQATTTGFAQATVVDTLAYFADQPPGTGVPSAEAEDTAEPEITAPVQIPDTPIEVLGAAPVAAEADRTLPADSDTDQPVAEVSETAATGAATSAEAERSSAEAETMLADAIALELAAPAQPGLESAPVGKEIVPGAEDELDLLVESATGLALGALAVELVVTDSGMVGGADVGTEPGTLSDPGGETDAAALGPLVPAVPDAGSLDERMQITLDTYIESSAASSIANANQLPEGFAVEEGVGLSGRTQPEDLADQLAAQEVAQKDLGPRFVPFTELTAVRRVPLEYPRRALDGAEGSVDVEFTVTESGDVADLSIEGDAPSVFLQEAFRAVSQWRFRPVLVNEEAVPVRTALRVTFRG